MLKSKPAAIVAIACGLVAGCASAPKQDELVPLETGVRLRYPLAMMQQGREGDVVVDCAVTTAGTTKNCMAVRSAGGAAFAQAALEYETQARYEPVLQDGKPVEVLHHEFYIRFRLGNHPEYHDPI